MFLRTASIALLIAAISAPAAMAGENDTVLAKAGDMVITKSEFDRLVAYMPPERQKFLQEQPDQKVTLLRRMIQVRLIADIARKEGFDRQPRVKEQVRNILDEVLVKEYLSAMSQDVAASDDLLRQYYARHKDEFMNPAQVRASHILIKSSSSDTEEQKRAAREKAEALLARARKGEDFSKLASENSDDLMSRSRGGDLGFFARGKMAKPFEEAAFGLKPGQISDLVETGYGFHIIKVEDAAEAMPKPFEEVKGVIADIVKKDLGTAKLSAFLEKAQKDAGLEVHPDRLDIKPAPLLVPRQNK